MFFNVKKGIFVAALTVFSSLSFGADYKAGVDYTVMADKTNAEDTVVEYFSVYCPHCYAMEVQGIPLLEKGLSDEIDLVKTPVDFMGFVSKAAQTKMGKAFILAREQGKADEFLDIAFPQYHRQKIDNPAGVLSDVLNIDEVEAELLISGDDIESAFAKEMAYQSELLKKGLKGTPAFIVNGKYLVKMSGLDQKDPLADLVALINYLNELD